MYIFIDFIYCCRSMSSQYILCIAKKVSRYFPGIRRIDRSSHTILHNRLQIHLPVLLGRKLDRHRLHAAYNAKLKERIIECARRQDLLTHVSAKWTTSSNTLLRSMGFSAALQIAFSRHCRPGLPLRSRNVSTAV